MSGCDRQETLANAADLDHARRHLAGLPNR
jgi:hypothetical protein